MLGAVGGDDQDVDFAADHVANLPDLLFVVFMGVGLDDGQVVVSRSLDPHFYLHRTSPDIVGHALRETDDEGFVVFLLAARGGGEQGDKQRGESEPNDEGRAS